MSVWDWMSWGSTKNTPQLAEEVEWNFTRLKALRPAGDLTIDDLRKSIDKLHAEVIRIKKEGVSVWNAKAAIPKIFDVVDGAFVTMKELVDKMAKMEARLDDFEKKE